MCENNLSNSLEDIEKRKLNFHFKDESIKKIYNRRFNKDIMFRDKMYNLLCKKFFQRYIKQGETVLDLSAGYCEFINNIEAREKIAIDLNPDIKKYAGKDVKVFVSNSTNLFQIKDKTIDVVFISNFFEHLSKEDINKTIKEVYRVIKDDGSLLVLQPNFRYCYKDYWMFFDHITALDHRSLCEVLETNNFNIVECKPKFLPYTTKGKLPKSLFLLDLYLKLPFIQKLLGKQVFIYAKKQGMEEFRRENK